MRIERMFPINVNFKNHEQNLMANDKYHNIRNIYDNTLTYVQVGAVIELKYIPSYLIQTIVLNLRL